MARSFNFPLETSSLWEKHHTQTCRLRAWAQKCSWQLAEKYDTIGIDGVAMAVNDVIRSGARPLAISDNIHAEASDPCLARQWIEGIAEGAIEANALCQTEKLGT